MFLQNSLFTESKAQCFCEISTLSDVQNIRGCFWEGLKHGNILLKLLFLVSE